MIEQAELVDDSLSDRTPFRYRTLKAPISVQVELTEACDNRCIYCYNFYRDQPGTKSFSPPSIRSVVSKLGEAEVFRVTFTGGEPMLELDTLLAGIDECEEQNIRPSLNSNLTVGTEGQYQNLKKYGLRTVLTSLSSHKPNVHDQLAGRKDAFRDAISGIKKASLAGLRLTVNMVVCDVNISDVYETGLFCYEELGVENFAATRVGPSRYNIEWFNQHSLSQDEIKIMFDQLNQLRREGVGTDTLEPVPLCSLGNLERYSQFTSKRCAAGITTCSLGVDGQVRPCSHADVAYGNVFNTNISKIWAGMEVWRNGSLFPKRCQSCDYLVECGGGCRVVGAFGSEDKSKLDQPDLYIGNPKLMTNSNVDTKGEERKVPEDFHTLPLRISERTKLREEDFGGIVGLGGTRVRLLTKTAFKFLKEVKEKEKEKFYLTDLGDEFGITIENLVNFLGQLYFDKVVVLADENH